MKISCNNCQYVSEDDDITYAIFKVNKDGGICSINPTLLTRCPVCYKDKYIENSLRYPEEYIKSLPFVKNAKSTYGLAKQRRKERELKAKGSHTKEDFIKLCAETNNTCYYCGKETTHLVREHKIPLFRNGSNDIDNIVPSCWKCNLKKGIRTTEEYSNVLQLENNYQKE
jgi:5-methylcytosine-specific restriction endonuclease McrA